MCAHDDQVVVARLGDVEDHSNWFSAFDPTPPDGHVALGCCRRQLVVARSDLVLEVGGENHYIVSDLGATFGRLGNNNLPIIYRLGRKTSNPKAYAKTKFIRRVEKDGDVILSYKGKNRGLFKGFTVEDARWLSKLMSQLSDKQIGDAFRAANYSDAEVAVYVSAVKRKIAELQDAAASNNLATSR